MAPGSSLFTRWLRLVPGAALWAMTQPLLAQEGPAVVTVSVVAVETRQPIAGVLVTVRGTPLQAITDGQGRARLETEPLGRRTVEARLMGFLPGQTSAVLDAGRTELRFELTPAPVELEGVEVQGARDSRLKHNGFFERRQAGQGAFFTREEIERQQPRVLTDLLRHLPGISLTPHPFGHEYGHSRASVRGSTGRRCQPQVFVDGAQMGTFNIDNIAPRAVEALEIYKGSATAPTQYNRGAAMCGLVLIWTRDR